MKLYMLVSILVAVAARPDVSHLLYAQHNGYNYPKPVPSFPTDQDKYPSVGSTVTVKPVTTTAQYTKPTPLQTGYNYNKPNVPFVLPASYQQADVQVTEKPFSQTQGVFSTFQQVSQQQPINSGQQVFTQNAQNFQQQVSQFNPSTTAQQVTQRPITTAQQVFSQNTVNIPQQVNANRPISTIQQDTQYSTSFSQQVTPSTNQQVIQNIQNVVNIPQGVKPQRPISVAQQQTLTQTSPQTFPSSQSTTVKPVHEDSVYDHVNYDEVSPSAPAGPSISSFISSLPTISGLPSVPSFPTTGSSVFTSFIPNVISQSSQFFPSSQTPTSQQIIAQDEPQPPATPSIPSFSIPSIPGFSNAPTIPPIASSGVSFLTSLIPNVASQSVSQFFPSSTTPNTNQFVAQDETQPSITASIPSIPGLSAIPGVSQAPAIFTSFIPNFGSQTPTSNGSTPTTPTIPTGGLSALSSFVPSFLNQGSSTTAPTSPTFPSFSQNGLLGTFTSFLPNVNPSTPAPSTGSNTATKAVYDIPAHQYNVPNLLASPESVAALTLLSQALPSIVTQNGIDSHKHSDNNDHHRINTINPNFSTNIPTRSSFSTTSTPSYATNLVSSNPSSFSTHSTDAHGRIQTVQPSQYSQETFTKTNPNYFIQDQSTSHFANEINNNYFPSSTKKPVYSQTITPTNKASQFTSKQYDQYPSSTISSFSTSQRPAFVDVTPAQIRSNANNEYLLPFTGSSVIASQSTTVQPTYTPSITTYAPPVQTNVIVPSHSLDKDGYHYKIPKTSFGF